MDSLPERRLNDSDEDLDDAELLADELARLDPMRPSEHQRAGGASRSFAGLLLALAAVGMFASIQLVRAEFEYVADPGASLSCDINPLIGCGGSIAAWQGHLLGVPNALLGTAAFGALAGVALMFLAGARVGRWLWQALAAAAVAGLALVGFFLQQSITDIGTLCPYCLLTWATVIPLATSLVGHAARGGHLPLGAGPTRFLYTQRWTLAVVGYAVVVVAATVGFWDQWRLVFGF